MRKTIENDKKKKKKKNSKSHFCLSILHNKNMVVECLRK